MKHQLKLLVTKYREQFATETDEGAKRILAEAISDIQAVLDEWAL